MEKNNEPSSKKIVCTLWSLFYFLLIIISVMGYILMLIYIFSPDTVLFFPRLIMTVVNFIQKISKIIKNCKPFKRLKIGPIQMDFNIWEILKMVLLSIALVVLAIVFVILIIVFILVAIVAFAILAFGNPVSIIDKLLEYSFLPGMHCLRSG